MEPVRFSATIRIRGVNPYVAVSARRAALLKPGWRRSLPVLVRVNGRPDEPWRINLMPVGDGSFYLYLHEQVRKASGTGVGDRVAVELSFDDAYRNGPLHPMPEWFRAPLTENPRALAAWNELTPSRQKEILRYFANLKSEEARARNVTRALRALSGPRERFLGRTWKEGS
jgi:hypothetical protein